MLEPLLPQGEKSGRPPVRTRRQLIDGIRFRVRTGTPWRDVPEEHGPWDRAYDLFRRQRRNGTPGSGSSLDYRPRADAKDPIAWDPDVDSTTVRAHQHVAGARKGGSAGGTARRHHHRADRPWPRALARWPDHQTAPGRRAAAEAHVDRHHCGAAGDSPRFEVVRLKGHRAVATRMTPGRSATRRPFLSWPSTSGCDQHVRSAP